MKQTLKIKIIKLLNKGVSPKEIQKALGVSNSYVYVVRAQYEKEIPKHIVNILKPIDMTPVVKDSFFTRLKKLFGV